MSASVVPMKEFKSAPKAIRSRMDTIAISAASIDQWLIPPFQRPKNVNAKVRALAEQLKSDGGVIPGIITLGSLQGDPQHLRYIVDGQHRIEAFKISGLPEAYVDARICDFLTIADMAEEFVQLNSSLVKMRPDDILRGLEPTIESLRTIKEECPFVGYDNIRRGAGGPVVGMSTVLRSWYGSSHDTPTSSTPSAVALAQAITAEDTALLVTFMAIAVRAWGRDPSYYRLWSGLNMSICMWLWRRLVVDQVRVKNRYVALNHEQFKACLMALSASADYLDWLPGRTLGDRDRSPCYSRIRAIFISRLKADGVQNVRFPQPAWAANISNK